MTNEEIILKSFNRAIEKGFQLDEKFSIGFDHPNPEYYYDCDDGSRHPFCYYPWPFFGIIFSHEFAKVFWGENEIAIEYLEAEENPAFGGTIFYPYDEGSTISYSGIAWKYHLQQMVLESEPLKYLEKFLD